MLMSLDQFVFSLTSAPFRELQRRRTWKHPTSSRVGARDGRQFAGVGDDTITLNGLVAPETFGSVASIRELAAMADTGEAYVLVDGAGNVYGAYVIAELNETQSYHTADGTPRRIEFQLTIERVDDDVLRTTREKNTRKDKR
ncbi:phage tail protein [Burkholderia pseudomallei]|uniref:phage tail protein n=1 Tax=Burkholderia pseudomallei TaxID=28450 RepID=UPI000979010F|nr:phage tail protein [Burkholderia pseudomallei]OMZ33112.1 oxidoreductase [Burkholderia pseudomallei]